MTDYDSWLEEPYDDEARADALIDMAIAILVPQIRDSLCKAIYEHTFHLSTEVDTEIDVLARWVAESIVESAPIAQGIIDADDDRT
jgi:hypothetical protein